MAYDNRNLPAVADMKLPEDAISYGIDHKKWRVLVEAVFPNAKTAAAIVLALGYCKAKGYDPFKRAVHIVPVYNSALKKMVETVWPGINSILTDAARTGAFAGIDPPVYGDDVTRTFREYNENGTVKREVEITFPEWCRITVYRMVSGVRCPFIGEVFWEETYAKSSRWSEIPNEMWSKRTRGQIAKCAQAAALRLAFPEAADYTAEEMEGKELPYGTKYAIEGEMDQPVDGHSEPGQATPEPEPEAKADAPAVVHFRLDGKRVKLPEADIMEKLTAKATSQPEVAAALVEQNWSWFAVDERKPILDAMLYAMDRNTASALEAFILTQQESGDEVVA
jgi:phage recombination protein Bet